MVSFYYQDYRLLIYYTCFIYFIIIFFQFHTNVMGLFYPGEGVTMFGGNRRSGREEVDSVRSFRFLSSRSVKIETKKQLRL